MFTSQRIVLNIFQSPKCPGRLTDKSNNGNIIYFLPATGWLHGGGGGGRGGGGPGNVGGRGGREKGIWDCYIRENDYFNKKIIPKSA